MTVASTKDSAPAATRREWRFRPLLFPLVSVALLIIAALVAHSVTSDIRLADVQAAVAGIPVEGLALALAFTAVSYAALASCDMLAVAAAAPGLVSYGKAAAAGALGFSISNVLGFSAVTGGAMRYRIYSAEGLDALARGGSGGVDVLRDRGGADEADRLDGLVRQQLVDDGLVALQHVEHPGG